MTSPKISAIIPVYNAEKYLTQALNSIITQTIKDIEIICVDDSSTDNSLQIIKNYAQKDSRIKIIQQKNSFAGVARNNGLKVANGEYVIFLDADDYFSPKMFETMYSNAITTNSDITICKSQTILQETGEIKINDYAVNNKYLIGRTNFTATDISKYIFQSCAGWAWDKLYKREFLLQNGLQFQALRHSNDTYFVLMSLILAKKISTINEIFVTYRVHSSSLANTRTIQPECFYYALKQLKDKLFEIKKYQKFEQSYMNYCLEFWYWHQSTIQDKTGIEIMNNYFVKLLKEIGFIKHSPLYFYHQRMYRKALMLYLTKFMNFTQ